jgi:hypothetical protein
MFFYFSIEKNTRGCQMPAVLEKEEIIPAWNGKVE